MFDINFIENAPKSKIIELFVDETLKRAQMILDNKDSLEHYINENESVYNNYKNLLISRCMKNNNRNNDNHYAFKYKNLHCVK